MNPEDIVQLREQAQQLRQRLQADPSREHAAAYLRWLRRSPHHVRAMLEAEVFMRRLHRLKLRGEWGAPSNVVHLPMAASLPHRAPRPTRSWRWQMTAAACAVVAVSTILLLSVGAAPMRSLSTGPGEWRQQRLIEGSSVKLGPNSAIQVRLAEDQREVKLLRGEAFFEVTRDAKRLFVVHTSVGEVRVLGTSFGVQAREGEVMVAVRKGRVAVQPLRPGNATESPPAPVELRANDRARLTQAGLARLSPLPADEVLAWVEQRFVARNLSFAEIAEELNRRHHPQIRINDPELARTHVAYLEVALDRPEALVELMRRWQAKASVELTEPAAVAP